MLRDDQDRDFFTLQGTGLRGMEDMPEMCRGRDTQALNCPACCSLSPELPGSLCGLPRQVGVIDGDPREGAVTYMRPLAPVHAPLIVLLVVVSDSSGC